MTQKPAGPFGVILCGGLGERFWPATDGKLPKYALKSSPKETFLSATFKRLVPFYGKDRIYLVTAAQHAGLVTKLLPDLPKSRVLAEPERKNTAGAVTFATLALKNIAGSDAVISFFPADAMIRPEEKFRRTLKSVTDFATSQSRIAVIGIRPTYPATGYGYIRRGQALGRAWPDGFTAAAFTEKPALDVARRFVDGGNHDWNAGIFTWKIGVFEEAIKKHAPEYFAIFKKAFTGPLTSAKIKSAFAKIPSAPIDRLLIEKMKGLATFKSDFEWDDIGTWEALRRFQGGTRGNAIIGEAITEDVEGCVVSCDADAEVIVAGVKNLAIVQRGNKILVCSLDRSQRVAELKKQLDARHANKK